LEEAGQKGEIQDALDKGGIDLVLMDILMPEKSGIEWLDEIVEKRIAPVVVLTGFGSEEIAVQSIHEGAIDYIPKDRLTKDRLLSTIKITLETWKRKVAEEEKRRLMEELEETNQNLERSNRELQDFTYIASHDLREPMRKISAFGQLLQESLKGKLDEDQQENFAFMIDGANRMQQMIDDLLAYSRVTTQAKPAKRVDLNKAIEDLKSVELAILLEETGGTIHCSEQARE
jgi:signal transduction histidine kinase